LVIPASQRYLYAQKPHRPRADVGQTIGFRRLPCPRQTPKNDALHHWCFVAVFRGWCFVAVFRSGVSRLVLRSGVSQRCFAPVFRSGVSGEAALCHNARTTEPQVGLPVYGKALMAR